MIDSERFKLLYGPYVVLKCAVGDKLPCEYRGGTGKASQTQIVALLHGRNDWPRPHAGPQWAV
jgi:hypothetical protein